MAQIERLIHNYDSRVSLPWEPNLAGPQRVWFAVYAKTEERRLRRRIEEFEISTRRANHGWTTVDLTTAFAQWLSQHDYRESYFENPDLLDNESPAMEEFKEAVTQQVSEALTSEHADENSVVAVYGLASLFGLMNKAAQRLGRLAKGVPKNFSREERTRRRALVEAINKRRRKNSEAVQRGSRELRQEQGIDPPQSSGAAVLDVACGPRMFWFDRKDPRAIFADHRRENHVLADRSVPGGSRTLEVNPDVIADFTDLPWSDNTFALVVFDPPHLVRAGKNGWQARKYGRLSRGWRESLRRGFAECFRVLRPEGTLIFKWNEYQVPVSKILALTPERPLLGQRCGKTSMTHWIVFMKPAKII